MAKYIIKRLLLSLLIILGVTLIVFTILNLTPGDPGRLILGQMASQEAVDELNHELGYDLPFLTRFFNYLRDVIFHLDFGTSYINDRPVFAEIAERLPVTFRIAFFSALFSAVIGIILGVLSAVKQYSLVDGIFSVLAMILSSIPDFWLGLVLLSIFSLKLKMFPSFGVKTWKGYVLPIATLTLFCSAGILRLTRSSMLDVINQDYIRTAKAKGDSKRTVIFRHALKNALLPVITSIGINFGALFGGAVTTEMVFAINGIGSMIVTAVRNKDIPVAMAGTITLAVIFCLIMLLVDIIQAFIDPRVRARYVTEGK